MADKSVALVPTAEREAVARAVHQWLNGYPDKPGKKIEYEYLNDTGMTVSTLQSPYKVKSFIDGTYQAQYQALVVYRALPTTTDSRFTMDEELERLASWAEQTRPILSGCRVLRVEIPNRAIVSARYDDGTEDHQIQINIIYEVKNYGRNDF